MTSKKAWATTSLRRHGVRSTLNKGMGYEVTYKAWGTEVTLLEVLRLAWGMNLVREA